MEPQDVDNRELLILLRQRANGRASQEQVAEALSKATLLLPIEQDEQRSNEGDVASLVEPSRRATILESEWGEIALVAFTHEGALREWAPLGSRYVGMSGRDVFATARDRKMDKVLINPGSPEGIQIGRRGIEALAQGREPQA